MVDVKSLLDNYHNEGCSAVAAFASNVFENECICKATAGDCQIDGRSAVHLQDENPRVQAP